MQIIHCRENVTPEGIESTVKNGLFICTRYLLYIRNMIVAPTTIMGRKLYYIIVWKLEIYIICNVY